MKWIQVGNIHHLVSESGKVLGACGPSKLWDGKFFWKATGKIRYSDTLDEAMKDVEVMTGSIN